MFKGNASGLALGLITILGACSHEGTTSSSPLSVAGSWTQGARLSETTLNQTHIHAGSFSFAQHGAAFTGSGQQSGLCHDEGGDYTGPLATGAVFQITEGIQQGAAVRFKTAMCTYEGLVSADGAHMAGTASCSYMDRGVRFDWSGDWLADRER